MRFRFSLRLLLLLFTITALAFGGAARFCYRIKDQVRRHKAAVSRLAEAAIFIAPEGGDSDSTWFTGFAQKWIDSDYCDSVSVQEYTFFNTEFSADGEQIADELNERERLTLLRDVMGLRELTAYFECLTQDSIALVEGHSRLQSLDIRCDSVDANALPGLRRLRALDYFLIEKPMSDETAVALAQLENLRSLDIDVSRLSPCGAEALGQLGKLDHVTLRGEVRQPAPIAHLLKNKSLKGLYFHQCRIADAAINALAAKNDLVTLSIDECRVGAHFFSSVAKSPRLENLHIDQCGPISELHLVSLQSCPCLKTLDFSLNELTEEEFTSLRLPPQLEKLKVVGAISDAAVLNALRMAPQCEITIRSPVAGQDGDISGERFTLVDNQLKCEPWTFYVMGTRLSLPSYEKAEGDMGCEGDWSK